MTGLFPLAFVTIGYLSNGMTMDACEKDMKQWLEARLSRNDWPARHASSEPPAFVWPWIVTIDYELALGNLGGEWGTRRYRCVLGIPISLGNDIHMES